MAVEMTGQPNPRELQKPQSSQDPPKGEGSASPRLVVRLAAVANGSALAWLGLALLCALVALQGMRPIANTDLGWHLALGREIVESRAIPDSEPFTHTARGAPMVAHEWLSQVIYHGVVAQGGLLSLRALHAALAVGIVLFLFALLRRQKVPPAVALLGVFLYVAAVHVRFQVRPQMFDLACLVGLYAGVFLYKPALSARQLVAIVAATILAANLHSGAVLFAALVGITVSVRLIEQWVGLREPLASDLGRGEPRRLVALALLVGGAVLVTPHHLRIVPYVLESGRINRALSMEWLPLLEFWGHPAKPPLALEAFLVIAIGFALSVVAMLRRREFSLAEIAPVAFVTGLAFYSQRFVVLAFAPLLFALPELSRVAPRGAHRESLRGAVSGVAIALALAGMFVVLWPRGSIEDIAHRFKAEAGFRASMFPIGAVRFLSELDLSGRLFNPSKWGGYVLSQTHTRYPIFVDGRWVTIGERVLEDSQVIARRKPGAFVLLEEYAVDLVLVHRGWMTSGMRKRDTWIPLFENRNAGLYLLRDPRNRDDLLRVAAYYRQRGIPFDPASGFDERAAYHANLAWAERMDVGPWHLDQSQAYGDNMGSAGKWVRGW